MELGADPGRGGLAACARRGPGKRPRPHSCLDLEPGMRSTAERIAKLRKEWAGDRTPVGPRLGLSFGAAGRLAAQARHLLEGSLGDLASRRVASPAPVGAVCCGWPAARWGSEVDPGRPARPAPPLGPDERSALWNPEAGEDGLRCLAADPQGRLPSQQALLRGGAGTRGLLVTQPLRMPCSDPALLLADSLSAAPALAAAEVPWRLRARAQGPGSSELQPPCGGH